MQLITEDQVRQVLVLAELTDALEDAMCALGRGEASSSIRIRSTQQDIGASALVATWPAGGVVGGKLYATKNGVFSFVIALFDLDGTLLGLLEGDYLTRLRTAAGTGVAIRHLLRETPSIATIIGTGRQCSGHLEILAQELPALEQIRVVGRRPEVVDTAVADAKRLGFKAVGSNDPLAAVEDAGLIITVTSSYEPLFPGDRLAANSLICALGSTKAERVEIGTGVTAKATRIIVDDLAGARTECGDLLAAETAGVFSWDDAEVLATVVASGRAIDLEDGLILFESQGIALQDVVAASLVLKKIGGQSISMP